MSTTSPLRERSISSEATRVDGRLVVLGETLAVESAARIQLLDLTAPVTALVRNAPVREGIVTISSVDTTCALLINEFQAALLRDIQTYLEELVATDRYYMHNDPNHSACDRMNADAHLRAVLLKNALTVQISGGEIVLGHWQRILMAELDGPHTRTLRLQIMGIADRATARPDPPPVS